MNDSKTDKDLYVETLKHTQSTKITQKQSRFPMTSKQQRNTFLALITIIFCSISCSDSDDEPQSDAEANDAGLEDTKVEDAMDSSIADLDSAEDTSDVFDADDSDSEIDPVINCSESSKEAWKTNLFELGPHFVFDGSYLCFEFIEEAIDRFSMIDRVEGLPFASQVEIPTTWIDARIKSISEYSMELEHSDGKQASFRWRSFDLTNWFHENEVVQIKLEPFIRGRYSHVKNDKAEVISSYLSSKNTRTYNRDFFAPFGEVDWRGVCGSGRDTSYKIIQDSDPDKTINPGDAQWNKNIGIRLLENIYSPGSNSGSVIMESGFDARVDMVIVSQSCYAEAQE